MLASVRKAVAAKGLPFDVAPEARLALLDLAAFRMWRDLNEHADVFMSNPLVRHLVHSPTEPFADPVHDESSPDLDLEAIEAPVPADAAQLTAVAWAKHRRTFVPQGPPGTGKSQTITNMIAECVRAGMKLLFVAEKQTALSVVQRRLDAIGLSPFTLRPGPRRRRPRNRPERRRRSCEGSWRRASAGPGTTGWIRWLRVTPGRQRRGRAFSG